MWPRTDLLDLLAITHPIIQAPMSGFNGPALVAAVSNAGPLGSLSCATMALVPQVVDAVGVPVIAAGGIADGRGIAAAFALGASGVQIGTAFLGCPEAVVPAVHRDALHGAADEDTRLTRVFTGRPARALRNRLIDEVGDAEALEFPARASLIRPLLQASSGAARRAFLPLWAGQAAPLIRDLPAAILIDTLVAECRPRLPSSK